MSTRQVWGGRYVVFEELASGGMATVYLAGRLGTGEGPRVVAIKKLFEQFAKEAAFVTMFLDEAHLAEQIRHPNVVPTREFLRVPGTLGIVMDFILGVALVDLLETSHERKRPVPPEVAVAVAIGILSGLHAAHELKGDDGAPLGVVHRDISPHNVLVGKDGVARIIDFGIAKAAGRLHVTDVGVMKGKFAYMAPEQIVGSAVDRRSDVFATAVVLWEALTGRYLFDAPTDAALIAKRTSSTSLVPRPSTFNRTVSRPLDAVVVRGLEADPEDRYRTAAEMAEALSEALTPASPDEVAAWVEELAGPRLETLAKMYAHAEASFSSGDVTASSDPAPARASVPDLAAVPDLELPRTSRPSLPGPISSARVLAAPRAAPRAALPVLTPGDMFDETGASGLHLAVEPAPSSLPMQSRVSSASLDVRAAPPSSSAREPRSRARSRRAPGRGFLVVAAVLVGLVLVVVGMGPTMLLSYVVGAAQRRGISLTADSVEPRAGGLTLVGVNASLVGASGVSLRAREVLVDLDLQGTISNVTVPGFELDVVGRAADIGTRFGAWQKRPFAPLPVEATAGHFVWRDALASTTLDAVNVRLSVGGQDEPSIHLDTPTLVARVPLGDLGPWRAALDTTTAETKLVVHLDRASAVDGPPSVTFLARPVVGETLSVAIPRAKPADIGVSPELLGVPAMFTLDLAVDGQAFPSADTLQAHAVLGLHGLPGAVGQDLVVEGDVSGDAKEMLSVQHGKLTVGKVSMPITGRFTLAPDGLRVEVDRPVAKGPSSLLVFDSRAWTAK